MQAIRNLVARLRFGDEARLEFYLDVSEHLLPGVPAAVALARLGSRMSHDPDLARTPSARLVGIAFAEVRDGRPLSDALSGWIPPVERTIIAEAEAAGDLPGGILEARLHEMTRRRGLRRGGEARAMLGIAGAAAAIALLVTVAIDTRGHPDAPDAVPPQGVEASAR